MKGRGEILHVTPHLGGGVGRVLLNYLARAGSGGSKWAQRLVCLDYANPTAKARALAQGLALEDHLARHPDELSRAMAEAAVVVLHWWNHPLMYQRLLSGPWPPCRLLIWSHVLGRSAPQVITPELIGLADLFAVASPVALKLPAVAEASAEGRVRVLFSSAGLEHVAEARPRPHRGFRVGYLGTVDYVKMHPDFIDLCLSARIPGAVFTVAGGPDHEALAREVKARGVEACFEILGPVDDVPAFLSSLDVFGYPLNPNHYGTGEQVLIEAQAAGVPPVVLGGGAEEFVVEHNETGLVASGPGAYGSALRSLYENEKLRRNLSRRARVRAEERFGLEKLVEGFENLYDELSSRHPFERAWPSPPGEISGWELFLISQGPTAAGEFEKLLADGQAQGPWPAEYLSASRGTVFHYAEYFPEDRQLKKCRDLLAAIKEKS